MRLYIIVWDDGTDQRCHEWTGTQADQKRIEKEQRAEGNEIARSETIEVPTDKPGLLQFLNTFRLRPDLDEATA